MTSVSQLLNKKRQQTADKRLGSKNAYKFKGGTTTIRILPTWRKDGDIKFFHEFGQAFIKNMDKETLAVIGDRQLTYGEDDPIRTLILRAKGDAVTDSQREFWHEMLAKPRILVNALVLDDKEVSPTEPQIIDFSETQFDNICEQAGLNEIADEFLDFNKGFNLKVNKTGTGFKTKYTFTFDRKPSAIDESVMENVTDIDAFVRSKFVDTDRAINALKTVMQSGNETRALSYSGNDETVIDGDYNAVDEARTVSEDVTVENRHLSDEEVDNLFGN